jgi:hypothetical protein
MGVQENDRLAAGNGHDAAHAFGLKSCGGCGNAVG